MTDAAQRLSASLAGRYRLERELGTGGMAALARAVVSLYSFCYHLIASPDVHRADQCPH